MTDIIFASTLSTILTITILLAMIISVGNECFSFTTFIFAALIVFAIVYKSDFFSQNWQTLAYISIAYIPIGVLVAMFKYKKILSRTHKSNIIYHTPSDHKGDIVGWIFYWPFVLIAYCLSDIIADIWNTLFRNISNIFVNIYNKHQDKP